ncbi:hypothetical protein H7Y40_01865 [Pedobacter sp.]|nr:hypothetical protein [Candidatus Saccharibacteria bacterium]
MQKSEVIHVTKDPILEEMLDALSEMETYCNDFINKTKKLNRRKSLVLASYAAAAQYSAGIRMMNEERPMAKVSSVLLRSFFGAWANLEYITLRKDDLYLLKELHLAQIGYEQSQSYLKAFYIENNVSKIGTLEVNKVRADQNKSRKSQKDTLTEIKMIEPDDKKIDYSSKTYTQLKKIDVERPFEYIEKSAYFNYLVLYPYLSSHVHLGIDGALKWFDIEGKNIKLNRSGETIEDVKNVVWTAPALLKDISIRAMHELSMYDEMYDKKYQTLIDKF